MPRIRSLGSTRGGGLLRAMERTGWRRGVFGTSRGWFYVGTGLWLLRKLRGLTGRQTEILLSEELKPGQRMIISNGLVTAEGTPTGNGSGRRGRKRKP